MNLEEMETVQRAEETLEKRYWIPQRAEGRAGCSLLLKGGQLMQENRKLKILCEGLEPRKSLRKQMKRSKTQKWKMDARRDED